MRSLREVLNDYSRRLFVSHSERRYAKRASAELLDLYWQQRRQRRQMARALYQSIVAQRLGPQAGRAAELVRRAEESFTDWPVERELKFRRVVHYFIFDEYSRLGNSRARTKTNMGLIVARVIPEEL